MQLNKGLCRVMQVENEIEGEVEENKT